MRNKYIKGTFFKVPYLPKGYKMLKGFEARFPKNHIITDETGSGSVMVYIPRFNLNEVIEGASDIPHPAFVHDGKILDGIYVSKFQNVIIDGRAYSIPGCDPATGIDFDESSAAALGKGGSWHIMSAFEWGAIALWCQKNGFLPHGNNDGGKDVRESEIVAEIAYSDPEKGVLRTKTGSGPEAWSHNGRSDGIYDLNANVWEWSGSMRLIYGEVQICENVFRQGADSPYWKAIDASSGELITPDGTGKTENSVKLDFRDGVWVYSNTVTDMLSKNRFCDFAKVYADGTLCKAAREILYSLALLSAKPDFDYDGVSLYANNGAAERIPFRGGRYGQGKNAGVFKTCLDDPRNFKGDPIGFRTVCYATK